VLNIHLDKLLIVLYVTTVIWLLVISLPHVWGANRLGYWNMINALRERGNWQLSDKIMFI